MEYYLKYKRNLIMKTLKKNLFTLTLLISAISSMNGQSFSIKGLFCNKNEKTISAHYTLKTGDSVISSGIAKKINLKLELNQNYSLTVTKKGCQSKTIYFSTYTEIKKDFRFHFHILLQEINDSVLASNKIAGKVFYDLKAKDFNYTTY